MTDTAEHNRDSTTGDEHSLATAALVILRVRQIVADVATRVNGTDLHSLSNCIGGLNNVLALIESVKKKDSS